MRVEFGVTRGEGCSCRTCRRNCMFIPGYLIPADLERMIPTGTDPLQWAESNLQASAGAVVMKDGKQFRIPTLVMAADPETGYCIRFHNRRCDIWETSPFGCAFFSCTSLPANEDHLTHDGLMAVYDARRDKDSLYTRIWYHLMDTGHEAESPESKRARMAE